MIEVHFRPCRHAVAARAVTAVAGFVHVVRAVTTLTSTTAQIAEVLAVMAIRTTQAFVATVKSKTGDDKVIEGHHRPTIRTVAIAARLAVAAAVHVIRPMAGNTGAANVRERFVLMA